MIRLVFALRRLPGMSLAEFQDYWVNRHGPLVAGFATDLKIHRYVQTHRVAELWWETEDLLEANMASEAGRAAGAALLEDERKFIDLPNSPLWFAYEYPQVNPAPETIVARVKSNVLRVFFPLRHVTTLSEERARHYWLTQHGPIVRSHAAATGVLCYRQVHRANHPADAAIQAARGTVVPSYLGHAEAWIDMGRAPGTEEARRANAAFIEDERNFIDFSRSTIFFGKEHTIIDRR